MIYADFENILVPEINGKENPENCYTNKYQKHVACNYWYKFACVYYTFIKRLKSYLGKDVVYNIINRMIEKKVNIAVILTMNLWEIRKTIKIFKTLLNVEYVIIIMLNIGSVIIMILK